MHLSLMLHRAYTKVFPLSTLRRFIADQILEFLISLAYAAYYIAIACIIITIASLAVYIIGYIGIAIFKLEPNRQDKVINHSDYIAIGVLFIGIGFMIGCTVALLCNMVYFLDYEPWKTDQTKYITELEQGISDVEAEFIPVRTNKFQRFSYIVLPLGSILRYIVRLIICLIVIAVIIIIHGYITVITFPFTTNMPWLLKWLFSVGVQLLIIIPIASSLVVTCGEKWKKFKAQQNSMVGKEI